MIFNAFQLISFYITNNNIIIIIILSSKFSVFSPSIFNILTLSKCVKICKKKKKYIFI